MTQRKPPGASFEGWVDHQIREAEKRGEFASLPGLGKPLLNDTAPYDEMWWIKGKMAREGVSYLSPVIECRKEAEELPASLPTITSEAEVRQRVSDLNKKITDLLLMPPPGPLLGIKRLDVDEVLREWRQVRESGR
ncbi:DnaJ family domain-containing protein [Streptomyces albipurpureus]|uniref:DUF1992 domain-containing protein n=1 Tax=Streptomyces albipurpureus TaxID=2897419 RepID=A0ABT0V048_9ACTN|nr:DUF1992 domain-containing protein [Streptomyces sp. CWNU-1]MCM2394110.1 DUF1992 domain-containing protein [Streptomyces sp. CWNU-1]